MPEGTCTIWVAEYPYCLDAVSNLLPCWMLICCVAAVKALQGLKACVQANQAGKGYLNGWGATNTGPAGNAAVTAAIQQTNKALAAAGVPGVTANTGLGTPGSGSTDNDPCGNPLPWTGILCTGDRVTQV